MQVTEHRLELAILIDVLVVMVFVALGLRTHDQESTVVELTDTALPFLIGLAAGWITVRAWKRPTAVLTGVAIWPITVLVGMVVRSSVFDRGIANSFIAVTTLFLGACLVGWRMVFRVLETRSARSRRDRYASGGSLIER